jgi:XTP/dITP diphosphohydrolase
LPALADDSGLEVAALGGLPGVLSKRFAGVDGPDHEVASANNAELLRRLDCVPVHARAARFSCVLVMAPPPTAPGCRSWLPGEITVQGTAAGSIMTAARGAAGFGYDPLFYSEELGLSFAEATAEQKHTVSHRGRAVAALAAALSQLDWTPDGA